MGDLFVDGGFEEAHAGVGDTGHAGIGDDGDGGTVAELLDELCGAHGLVVLVVGDEGFVDSVVLEEDSGVAGVFCRDEVDGAKGIEGSEGDISEIADGSCDEVEHGFVLPALGDGGHDFGGGLFECDGECLSGVVRDIG